MKSYLSLIPISAKVHRRQNRMTIICIILAVFLVTAIFSMAEMELRSQQIRAIINYGNWHIGIKNISEEDAALIAERPDVEASSPYEALNYRLRDNYELGGKQIAICAVGEDFVTDIYPDGLAEGAFPDSESEVILTYNAKEALGTAIGDTVDITIPTGDMIQYTVSGFVTDTIMTDRADAIAVLMLPEPFKEICAKVQDRELTDIDMMYYVQFKDNVNIAKSIQDVKTQFNLTNDQVGENTALLGAMGYSGSYVMQGLYVIAGVLFVLVLTAGVLMIASSMNSNIAQRTEFFGMLRCIGAEKKHVMRFVRLEALNWCKTAIPIGVGIGVVLTWTLCAVLRALSAGFFSTLPVFGVSISGIIMGIIVGLLTVLIAAQAPAKKASKVSPLAAVSGNTGQVKNIRRAANTRIMKIETALGIHHAKQNKKNLLLMSGSFAVCIVLFLCFSTLIDFMHHALTPLRPYTPDVSIVSKDNTCSVPKDIVTELYGREGIKRVFGRMFAYDIPAEVNGEAKNVMLISYEAYQMNWVDEEHWESDRVGFEKVVKDTDEGYVMVSYKEQNNIKDGDVISTSLGDLTVAATLYVCPFTGDEDTIVLVCSEALFTKLTGETDYTIIDIQLSFGASEEDVEAVRAYAGQDYTFSDRRLDNQEAAGAYYSFVLFIYGFLAIIAMITVFNIMNSVSMSVSARMKQYGAMRAVGMDMAQMKRMIYAETFTYALSGTIAGVVLGIPLHWFSWQNLIFNQWKDPWRFPVLALIIIVALVIVSCILAVRNPLKRIENMSVVDVISEQ